MITSDQRDAEGERLLKKYACQHCGAPEVRFPQRPSPRPLICRKCRKETGRNAAELYDDLIAFGQLMLSGVASKE
ncbi:MAG: hypothetical protein ACTHM2_09660 [Afipia sp.]